MSTRNRRPSPSLSSSSGNRAPIPQNPNKKATAAKPQVAKKRTALCDVTNQRNGSQIGSRSSASSSKPMVPCTTKVVKTKKETSSFISNHGISGNVLPESLSSKSSILVPYGDTSVSGTLKPTEKIATNHFPSSILHTLRRKDVSPSRSVSGSVSLDESMSTSNSLKSPEFDYIDSEDISEVKSIEKKTINSLYTTDIPQIEGTIQKRDIFTDAVTGEEIIDIDDNLSDPQFCATIASDIYKYLLESEVNRRPSMDYMETVQNDIDARMRAVLIDWLVEVAEEFRLIPDTLFLAVNYVDRYLSGNAMKKQRLQLLGVACMMIAAKYEEIHVPEVDEFCYITDNTYFKDEVLQMESDVLNHLKFEMAAPTAMCFLRRFCSVAERTSCEVPPVMFQCLAHYIAELSLLEYCMLGFAPSLIAASATFLAKYILSPLQKPWNSTLRHYTTYRASDLCDCVKVLHHLCCNGSGSNLAAVREKYCQHKYKFVAKKYCPPSIPPEFFHHPSN
ncbi:cyclin-A1-4-like [Argentina anserina]|uniref:cyclin-A1-4-like n=1 Tax=Argentina anserina TaxID=57926 RepID=UPI0021766CB9|nr:cyclin-A1-4-like [Potentilla anserina]